MTNEEKYIREHVGNRTPFKVPDGYFERLVPELMERLPERPAVSLVYEKPTVMARVRPLFNKMRPVLYAAAVVLIAVFCVGVYLDNENREAERQQIASQMETSDDYYNEVADYAMVDNIEIYACLSE
jgi:cell division protein FtsL